MEISAGGGGGFGVVVVLTMLSAMSFDLRRSWDLEGHAELDDVPQVAGGQAASGGSRAPGIVPAPRATQ